LGLWYSSPHFRQFLIFGFRGFLVFSDFGIFAFRASLQAIEQQTGDPPLVIGGKKSTPHSAHGLGSDFGSFNPKDFFRQRSEQNLRSRPDPVFGPFGSNMPPHCGQIAVFRSALPHSIPAASNTAIMFRDVYFPRILSP
jgi:hypothetical protein